MSQAYNLFKTHASTALADNNSAAALEIVNDPEGIDLAGTAVDHPRTWAWFRDQVGNADAVTVRATVEAIVSAKPANPVADPTAYAFGVNAAAILAQLDTVGISPCDSELRLALRTIIEINPPVADAFAKALHLGYQSHASKVLGREATDADFQSARAVYLERQAETERSNREESVIAELNTYADAGREVISNGGTVDEAWVAIKAALVAGGR